MVISKVTAIKLTESDEKRVSQIESFIDQQLKERYCVGGILINLKKFALFGLPYKIISRIKEDYEKEGWITKYDAKNGELYLRG